MKISEMKDTRYLKKEDCGEGGIVVTIAGLKQENVGADDAEEMKWILFFKEKLKPMVLNWTNTQLISKALGSDETDEWIGKKIVLYNDVSVSFGDRLVGGIRVRKWQTMQPRELGEDRPPPGSPADYGMNSADPDDKIPF